ncbi:MAG TPA: amidohydrolase family protein [Acidimicrobiales bacterium]|nr:amidohydrolase family protein [Acidimicrobiales bacterium]
MHEIVIRGGSVINGTGAAAYAADVGVDAGRITGIGPSLSGRTELDASGHVVAPGFIDIHTHYDAQVFWDPGLSPSCFHGVTTVVAGNCGFSIAPIRPPDVALLARTLQHVEDMSFDTLSVGVPWDSFETFPQYLDAVEAAEPALNFACYVGHTALRLFAMGEEAYERQPTPAELGGMQAAVAEAIAAGAAGFATSASPTHNGDDGRPVPSRLADLDELRALLQPLREADRGVVALLPGGVISNEEMFQLQREIRRPFTWTALLTVKGYPYHQKVIQEHDAARAEGVEVWPQVSCRPLVFQMNLAEPFTLNTRECFSKLMGTTRAEREAAYRDPSWRAAAWTELSGGGGTFPVNWSAISVAESKARSDLIGRGVPDLAAEWGTTPLDVLLDISLGDDLTTRFWSVVANDDPEGIAWLLPRDNVLLGLADSGAHVSQLCDACFATDLLGNWVRDRSVLPLERAVHKLTGEPAAVYSLHDRGTIEEGKAADICVFDPETVAPGPLRRVWDFPANGERLTADQPSGVAHVLVNGVPIRRDGQTCDGLPSRPGKVLRGGTP